MKMRLACLVRQNSQLICWLFKIVLILFWVFWALQIYSPMRDSFCSWSDYQKSRNVQTEKRNNEIVSDFAQGLVRKAEKVGSRYSPEMYFRDLASIHKAEEKYQVLPRLAEINTLRKLSQDDINKGYFSMKDVDRAREKFKFDREQTVSKTYRQEAAAELKNAGWQGIGRWVYVFYLRTILLIFFLYLLRMMERGRTLATILADKKTLVLAVIAWPVYWLRYPHDLIREFQVEAQMRRLENLFRRLRPEERQIARRVAASPVQYRIWMQGYQQQYANQFQRGLLVAMLATLFCWVFFPFFTPKVEASTDKHKETSIITFSVRGSPQAEVYSADHLDEQRQDDCLGSPGDLAERVSILFSELWQTVWIPIQRLVNGVLREIEHIPNSGCWFANISN